MILLKITLVLIFTVGIIIPICTDCDFLPIVEEYFGIIEIETNNLRSSTSGNPKLLSPNSDVNFKDYEGLELKFIFEYHVQSEKCNSKFSLIPTLMVCDCEFNGYLVSIKEMIENFTITTLNNFNPQYSVNYTLNDLFVIDNLIKNYSLEENVCLA